MENQLPDRRADAPVRPLAVPAWRAEDHCLYCAAPVPQGETQCAHCKAVPQPSAGQMLRHWGLFLIGIGAIFALAAWLGG
jgi:predicted nucleic acid-binding Zn ribbon protein